MEFIKNNLAIFITAGIAILSGIFNLYQYLLNRKLKRYDTKKKLKQKKAELEKLVNNYSPAGTVEYYIKTLSSSIGDIQKEKSEFVCKKKCLEAEIEYLEKILKMKNK